MSLIGIVSSGIDAESLKGIDSARPVKPHAPSTLVDSRSEYGLQVLCMITGEARGDIEAHGQLVELGFHR